MRSRLRRVILHPGLHKTGSSVVQFTLGEQPGILPRSCGFIPLRELHRALYHLLTAVWDDPSDTDAQATLRARIRELAESTGKPEVLLSYEGLPGRPDTAYAEAPRVVPLIAEALDGLDVRVVIDVKRQDRFIESLYLQRIQMGQEDRAFDEWYADTIAPLLNAGGYDWLAFVRLFADAFGDERVRVRPFLLPRIGAEAHLRRFLHDIGHPTRARLRIPANTNQSYSGKALEIARSVNHLLNDAERRDLRLFLRERFGVPKYPRPALMNDATRGDHRRPRRLQRRALATLHARRGRGRAVARR